MKNNKGQQGAQENQRNQESSENSLEQPGGRHAASSVASLPRNVPGEERSDEVAPSRSDALSQKKRAAVRRQALDNDSVAAALGGEDDEAHESSGGLHGGLRPNQASSPSTGTPSLHNELAEMKRVAVRRQVLDGRSSSNAPMPEEEEDVVEAPELRAASPSHAVLPVAYPVSRSGNAVRRKDVFVFHAERVDVAMNGFIEQGSPVLLDDEMGLAAQRRRGQWIVLFVAAGILGVTVAAISIGILVSRKGKSEAPVSQSPSFAPSAGPCVVNDPVPGDVYFSGEVDEYLEIGQRRYGSPVGRWCVRNVTDFVYAFYGHSKFNEPLNMWDVSRVETMSYMFQDASSFNQDISSWDVSRVKTMWYMFNGASSYRQDLCAWGSRMRSDAYVYSMFRGTDCPEQGDPNLTAIPVSPLCFACT